MISFRQLVSNPAFGGPTKDQGKPFLHPLNYVVAAIADASKTLETAKAHLEEVRGLTNIFIWKGK
jgi:type IV secretory pathway TrbL component